MLNLSLLLALSLLLSLHLFNDLNLKTPSLRRPDRVIEGERKEGGVQGQRAKNKPREGDSYQ
jgi:hypothetical protein